MSSQTTILFFKILDLGSRTLHFEIHTLNLKRLTIIIILIILAVIVASQTDAVKNIGKPPKIYSEKATVKKENIKEIVSGSGKIQSNTVAILKFQTSGLLTYIGVKRGDIVKKGQLVASLDQRELQKNLKKKLNDYMSERWDFEEDKQITYKDIALNDTIKRALEKNQFALDKTVWDVEISDIALKFGNLYSPIDGIVTEVDAPQIGVNITAATGTFTVADFNDISFKIDVDEVDIGKILPGQMVDIKLDAYPEKTFFGAVSKIGFTSTTTSGGGTAFPVEVKFPDNTDLRFKIGMNGDAEIVVRDVRNTIIIPAQFINEEDSKKFVYVLKKAGKSYEKRVIKTGIETDDAVEILEGLKQGEIVMLPQEK